MISTSDLVILVLASAALSLGLYRWYDNTQQMNAITIPASSYSVPANNVTPSVLSTNTVVENESANSENTTVASNNASQYIDPNQLENDIVPMDEVLTQVATTEPAPQEQLGTYVVVSGDYLAKIARQFSTDVTTLQELNGISGSTILIGQEILYPIQ